MNRPPQHKLPQRPRPLVARFDPDNRELIEGAWSSGEALTAEQRHVVDCLVHAMRCFELRLNAMRPWPVEQGEWFFKICKPATFFDEYVVTLVMQSIATQTCRGVALGKLTQPPGNIDPKWGCCPDVVFSPRATK